MNAYVEGHGLVRLQRIPASSVSRLPPKAETEVTFPVAGYQQQLVRLRRRVLSYTEAAPEPEPEEVVGTAEYVRARFAEAMRTLMRLPYGKTDRPSAMAAGGIAVVHGQEGYGYTPATSKLPPTSVEIDRMAECLDVWLLWVPREAWQPVTGVALGIPLRRIARRMSIGRRRAGQKKGISYETVRKLEKKAVERIARRLAQSERATFPVKHGEPSAG